MENIYISLGTNIGDRASNLERALVNMRNKSISIKKLSSVYESEAWGHHDQPSFLNQVIEISTETPAPALLHQLKAIEKEEGRIKREKWREREIDLDILYYGQEIIKTPHLQIPHRYVRERRFVLIPLNEIASEFTDPETGSTIGEITRSCADHSKVLKI